MKTKRKLILIWSAFVLCLLLTIGFLTGFFVLSAKTERGRSYEVKATLVEGNTIYRPEGTWGYRYGPTMMYKDENTLEAWFSSPSENTESGWDMLTYRSTDDFGKTWTNEYVSIAPLAGTEEALSVCDPGVLFMDGYYYMFYTSTIELEGRYNNVYCARATAPDAEWERWNGNGWGGEIVKAIVTYGSNAEHYGIGEPSVLVKDEQIYIYYTYKGMLPNGQIVNQTRLTIGDATENFPLTLKEYGVVVGDKEADEDSLDVKYSPEYGIFIGLTTEKRMSYRSAIKMYYSYDGKNFKEGEVDNTAAMAYSHNIGISGDGLGHIDFNKPQFVSYAYSEDGFVWGSWATEFQQITFTLTEVFDEDKANGTRLATDPGFADGIVPNAWALSTSSEYRTALEAVDGDRNTFYSSVAHNVTGINEWQLGKWYREALAVPAKRGAKGMRISPRLANGGEVYGFPRSFLLQSSQDGVIWETISEYSDYKPVNDEPITFSFGKRVKANYFRIYATELGEDEFGSYIMQISEIELV